MGEVRWTDEAEAWLREIHDYIARDNPVAAASTIRGIIAKAESLNDFPERGYRYPMQPERNVRIVPYGHHRIAYIVTDSGDVDVLGVFHGALDLERHLR